MVEPCRAFVTVNADVVQQHELIRASVAHSTKKSTSDNAQPAKMLNDTRRAKDMTNSFSRAGHSASTTRNAQAGRRDPAARQ